MNDESINYKEKIDFLEYRINRLEDMLTDINERLGNELPYIRQRIEQLATI